MGLSVYAAIGNKSPFAGTQVIWEFRSMNRQMKLSIEELQPFLFSIGGGLEELFSSQIGFFFA